MPSYSMPKKDSDNRVRLLPVGASAAETGSLSELTAGVASTARGSDSDSHPPAAAADGCPGPSRPVSPPLASSIRSETPDRGLGEVRDSTHVLCPAPWGADALMTNLQSGEPTIFFRLAMVALSFAMSLTFCCGTFFTPSLIEAYETRDFLLGGSLIAGSILLGPVGVLFVREVRHVCRCKGDEAMLIKLGAGSTSLPTTLLSQAKFLRLLNFDLQAGRGVWGYRAVMIVMFGPSVIFGWGLQSPWHNRVSGAAWLLWAICGARMSLR
eukprot:COSAG02_NODE_3360_length_6871_cov_3.468104_7_plen_268_part_00